MRLVVVAALFASTVGCEPDCYDCDFVPECEVADDCNIHGGQCTGAAYCNTSAGLCDLELLPQGTLCDENGGQLCDRGVCAECLDSGDCVDGLCRATRCAPLSCGDDTLDGDETDVDCGGICGPCGAGQMCEVPTDCGPGLVCNGVCR